jgi:hypothetical protein
LYKTFKNSEDTRPSYIGGDYVGGNKVGGDSAGRDINKNVYTVTGDRNVVTIGDNNEVTMSIQDIDPQFKESLLAFQNLLNEKLKNTSITDKQKKSLLEDMKKLSEQVKDVNPNEVIQDEDKIDEIKATQISLAEKIVNFVPQVAESIASATPLAPFSKSIGKGAGFFADWIIKKMNRSRSTT